eukprot:1376901-Rhodomonas_salina.3
MERGHVTWHCCTSAAASTCPLPPLPQYAQLHATQYAQTYAISVRAPRADDTGSQYGHGMQSRGELSPGIALRYAGTRACGTIAVSVPGTALRYARTRTYAVSVPGTA